MIVAAVVLIAIIAAVVVLAAISILGRRWHCCGSCGGKNVLVPAGLWGLVVW